MYDILSMNLSELEQLFVSLGEKKFRARQVFENLHKRFAKSFMEMTNLPLSLRQSLTENENILFSGLEIKKKLKGTNSDLQNTTESDKSNFAKYLFILQDFNIIETVLMNYSYGNSVCVSSQVGCRMGCSFCASSPVNQNRPGKAANAVTVTNAGFKRNLTAGEMLLQVYQIQKEHPNDRISHVVIMGIGEPLDNYDEVIRFISLLNSENGLAIGQRHITLSTCGLAPKIIRLADEKINDKKLQINLAVSLHAPTDELRRKLMPVAKKYSLEEVMEACSYYIKVTNRRVSFEYTLIHGVNDSRECAALLGKLLRGKLVHVNIIQLNPVHPEYKRSTNDKASSFVETLKGYGVETTIRKSLGGEAEAACGQLRSFSL